MALVTAGGVRLSFGKSGGAMVLRGTKVVAVAIGAVLGLSALGPVMVADSAEAASTRIVWRDCGERALDGFECGTLTVPRDYQDASAGTFDLYVVRLRAQGSRAERIGTLFFNPGGPGISAVDIAGDVAGVLPQRVRQRFDFVTWDPRGVGRSSGLVECQGGTYALPDTGPVDWASVTREMRDSEAAANRACEERYPDVVPYIGTRSTARDLDRLRQALGDKKITYFGTSYGTRIGYVYAHDFPNRVRAMLLTSPVDPTGDWASFISGSSVSPDNAVGFFFEAYPSAARTYRETIRLLDSTALQLPSGARFTRWHLNGVLGDSAKSGSAFQGMADLIKTVHTALVGKGAVRQRALKRLDAGSWPARYPMGGGSTAFIDCLDFADRISPDAQDRLAAISRAQAPIFGWAQSQGYFFCEGMTVAPDPVPTDFVNDRTPMLVMGSTRDGLTLYQWATNLARTFTNSRVITYVGTTHSPYPGTSPCIDAHGTAYLVNLRRPAMDATCPTAVVPGSGTTRG